MSPVETHTLAVPPMPKFTREDYAAAAMAARVASAQAIADAKKQTNPSIAAIFHRTSVGYRQLAAKFDQASKAR